MNQKVGAAVSAVLGIVVGVFTNLVTSGPTLPLVLGFVSTAVLWVVLTALQRSPDPTPTSQTHGTNSPIINADNNSGNIGVNTPPPSPAPEPRREEPDAGSTPP